MNEEPITPYEEILQKAAEKGRLFRERGGTFRTTQAIRHGSTIRYYKVLYPPAQYSADGVLIPQEPRVTDQLVGIETVVETPSPSTSHEPVEVPQQHARQEQDLRRPVLA